MRRPYVAGNWKMNLDRGKALQLAGALRESLASPGDVDVAVCPSFVYLAAVAGVLEGTRVALGGQDVCAESEGAFTGEVSVSMLKDVGATLTIIGHSERRHVFGETDEQVNAKVRAALDGGLEVILCVGETLEEREAGETEAVVDRHLTQGLRGVGATSLASVTIAYEPVWAIGTGRTATPEQAGEVHRFLRNRFAELYDASSAEACRIQYGGSVKPGNMAELMAVPDIDGALVGGASLDPESFLRIIRYRP